MRDWMNREISDNNSLCYNTFKYNNTVFHAMLTESSMYHLSLVESFNADIYEEWLWLFYAINENEGYINPAYNEMIDELNEECELIYNKNRKIKKITR